jgi:hypothetical protein
MLQKQISYLPSDCMNHIVGYTYSPQPDTLMKSLVEEVKKNSSFRFVHGIITNLKGAFFLDVLYYSIVENLNYGYEYSRYERMYFKPRFVKYKNQDIMSDILFHAYNYGINHTRTSYINVCRRVWSLMTLEEIHTHLIPCIQDTVVQQWYERKYWEMRMIPQTISPRFSWMFYDGVLIPEYNETLNFYIQYYNNNQQ